MLFKKNARASNDFVKQLRPQLISDFIQTTVLLIFDFDSIFK
jgi:hypothetical protein